MLVALAIATAARAGTVQDVRAHGAKGDGTTPDTAAIGRAVAACVEAGGGVVRFPAGRYLSGTVRLRSKVTLLLEAGATLVGTTDLAAYEGYRPPEGVFEARLPASWHHALVLGVDVEDVAIEGPGTIDGNNVRNPRGEERMRGPHAVLIGQGKNIRIRGVTIRDAANYGVMLEDCSGVDIHGVTISGGWDGIHFRGWPETPCRDVTITGCRIATGDDAIAGRYWEDTLIAGCVINSSCNGIRLIGPARGLIIQDCLFYGPGRYPHITSGRRNMLSGINLQPGGWDATRGRLDNVLISDVTMRDVHAPVHLSVKPGNTAGRVTVERLSATGVYGAALSAESWAETPIERVVLRDLSLEFAGGGKPEEAGRAVKAPGVDARPLPAWGVFARGVATLDLDGVRLRLAAPDVRPAIRAEDVGRLVLRDLRHDGPAGTGAGEPIVLDRVGAVVREPAAGR
jgi:hypothetical protein